MTKRMRLNARDGEAMIFRITSCCCCRFPSSLCCPFVGSSSSTGNLSPISTLKILSWNVDGLDSHSDEIDMTARTMSVASHIIDHRPHIVLMQVGYSCSSSFLPIPPSQELIDFNMTWLRRLLSKFYDFYIQSSPPLPYFVGILIDRSAVAVHGPLVTDNFANTKMGRALVRTSTLLQYCGIPSQVSLDGEVRLLSGASVKVHIATAHLESTKSFGRARVDQLKVVHSLVAVIFVILRSLSPTCVAPSATANHIWRFSEETSTSETTRSGRPSSSPTGPRKSTLSTPGRLVETLDSSDDGMMC